MAKWRNKRGASAVEFALVLPILILLFIGIVDFGLLIYDKQVITNATRVGARAGLVSKVPRLSASDITGVVDAYAKDRLVSLRPSTRYKSEVPSGACTAFGNDLVVTAAYDHKFLLVTTVNLTSQASMKCE